MAYIGVSPSNGVRRVHTYTATASQTTFSGAGAEGTSLSYKDSNFVDVYQNGVKLGDADYTATSGTSIVLGTGATASDLVVIVVFDVFSVADTVSKADGGTFDGNVTMAGTLDVTGAITSSAGATITTADNNAQLTLKSTDADSSIGPVLELARDSASPADGDAIGQVKFTADNDAGEATSYATITGTLRDASDGTEDAQVQYNAMVGGSSVDFMRYGVGSDAEIGVIFNEGSIDADFRVESNGSTSMLFVNGGANVVSFDTTDNNPAENNVAGVGILSGGKISASADGNFGLQVNRKSSFGGVIHLRKDGSGGGFLAIFEDSSAGRLLLGNDNTCLLFNDSAKQIIPFQSTGSKQDDVIALGNASGRFDQVFSANGSLNTSDRNEKQDIEELTDAEKRVAVKAKSLVRKYRWKKRVTEKGDNARTHVGIIAQDLQDAFTAEGLDATKYGMFCSDTWWDNDEVFVDDNGKEHNIVKSYYTEEEAPEGSTKRTRLAVRYSELLAFIISAI